MRAHVSVLDRDHVMRSDVSLPGRYAVYVCAWHVEK